MIRLMDGTAVRLLWPWGLEPPAKPPEGIRETCIQKARNPIVLTQT